MKLPDNINRVKLSESINGTIFPPFGFLPIEDTNDGGGDYYGLYWELGKEHLEPIVCSSRHEEALLIPEFPNFNVFIDWFDETQGQETPRMNLNDNSFFISLLNKGKILTKKGETGEAIEKLEKSVSLFSEYSESWYWLAKNYYQSDQREKGDIALINSILSNYFLGLPSNISIDLFNKMEPSDHLKSHPLIKRKSKLITGGDFANPLSVNYELLLEAIEEFKLAKEFRSAFLLEQNFGLLLSMEPSETALKYNFNRSNWMSNFKNELVSIYPLREH